MFDPTPFASGREADVFAVDARRVLRRYRHGGDVAAEADVMIYLAEAGFPVPTVYDARGTDLVMERVDGPTMLQALVGDEIEVREAAELLADLHQRLHKLAPRLSADPNTRILHLDLHPDNVMLSGQGPVVIDWHNAAEGPPDLDVAMTAVILAQVAVDETHPMAASAASMLSAFLRHAGGDVWSVLDSAVAMRAADPGVTVAEVDRLAAAETLITQSIGSTAPDNICRGQGSRSISRGRPGH